MIHKSNHKYLLVGIITTIMTHHIHSETNTNSSGHQPHTRSQAPQEPPAQADPVLRPPRKPPRPPKMYHHIISFYTDSHFTIFTLLFSLKETYHDLLEVWILVFPFFNLVFYVLTYIRLNFNFKYFFLQEMLLLKNVFLFWCDHHVQSAASVSHWPISK